MSSGPTPRRSSGCCACVTACAATTQTASATPPPSATSPRGTGGTCRTTPTPSPRSSRRFSSGPPAERLRAPLGGEQRVDDDVEVGAAHALGLTEGPLLAEAEPLRDRATARVADRGADLDPVQLQDAHRVLDQRGDRAGHQPPTLIALAQPVADARRAVGPVERLQPGHAGDRAVTDDGERGATLVGALPAGQPDELARPFEVLALRPRQPWAQVRAVAVDQRGQLVRIGL